jgi:hypothetical protein
MSAANLTRSRTAWTTLAGIVVAWAGRNIGLTPEEMATLQTVLGTLVISYYLQDKARARR